MKQSAKLSSPVGVGVIAILTVLLVLCLTIFSVLSLSAAQADLRLSQTNADTVSAYYAADAQAAQLYAAFAGGDDGQLEAEIPVNDTQVLSIRLVRGADGAAQVEAWQLITNQVPGTQEDYLPVYTGEEPNPSGG